MSLQTLQTVWLEKREGVAIITMNRPDSLNALNHQMKLEMGQVIAQVSADTEVRAVVITGAGRAFCAGGDVKEYGVITLEHRKEGLHLVHDWLQRLLTMPKPVIAAVNGPATGAGMNIALASDIVIASERATFSEIFIRAGLIPDMGGSWLLSRVVGLVKAKELCLTGDIIDAREAERLGLVSKVVAHDELMTAATELAQRLARGPAKALALTKKLINEATSFDLATALQRESEAQQSLYDTADHREALAAFREKRPPKFTGR